MSTHHVQPDRRSLHGHFSRDLDPILTVDSGDSIVYRTLDAGWGHPDHTDPFTRARRFEPMDEELDSGHALQGPVAVRGAEPGMTLEIRIRDIRPGGWGWSVGGGWPSPVNDRLGLAESGERVHRWALDADTGVARNQLGHTVEMRPFLGVLGLPPAESGRHSTVPPRHCGGNLDCKELVAGTTLFLPVTVPGALFSLGDGHAVQGDGEVSGVAIECPMERVEVELHRRDDISISMPRAWTPEAWITFGLDIDLNEAMLGAVEEMVGLMEEVHGLDRRDAVALASLLMDLRITQVVNRVNGVHAMLRHDALRMGERMSP